MKAFLAVVLQAPLRVAQTPIQSVISEEAMRHLFNRKKHSPGVYSTGQRGIWDWAHKARHHAGNVLSGAGGVGRGSVNVFRAAVDAGYWHGCRLTTLGNAQNSKLPKPGCCTLSNAIRLGLVSFGSLCFVASCDGRSDDGNLAGIVGVPKRSPGDFSCFGRLVQHRDGDVRSVISRMNLRRFVQPALRSLGWKD